MTKQEPVPDAVVAANGDRAVGEPAARLTLTPGRGNRVTATIHLKTEEEEEEEQLGATPMSSVLTLCNSAIGAGVLSLPYAFRLSGAQDLPTNCLFQIMVAELCSRQVLPHVAAAILNERQSVPKARPL